MSRLFVVEVEGYDGEDGAIDVQRFSTDTEDHTSTLSGGNPKLYCVAQLCDDGVLRFIDWGYMSAADALAAWPEASGERSEVEAAFKAAQTPPETSNAPEGASTARRWVPWQLADEPEYYGEDALCWILVSEDGEEEHSASRVFATREEAQFAADRLNQ